MATEAGGPAGRAGLSQLPGFDTAPDVYETGDDDTVSTEQTHSAVPSEASNTSDEEDGEASYGVSRRRLYPERARSRFGDQNRRWDVDAHQADSSDRVDGKRQGLRIRRREGRGAEGKEGLEARIARLRREVEECRVEAEGARRDVEEDGEEDIGEDEGGLLDDCEVLSKLLSGIDVPGAAAAATTTSSSGKRRGHRRGGSVFHDAPTTALPPDAADKEKDGDGERGEVTDEQTLANVSAFDTRLSALEAALGISSLDAATEPASTSAPILPTLTLLDHQLATLTTATSLSSLEHVFTRIQKLKFEAQNLRQLQQQQSSPASATTRNGTASSEDEDTEPETITLLSPTDMAKLQSLYTLIPTLQSLSPTVPALISRLRSLRTLHTTAANASADLESVEQRQAEMDKELNMWREGLQKVEEAVRNADEANGRNGNFVKGWVEDLEGRVKGLGR